MNGKEDVDPESDSSRLPPPPPFPGFLFSSIPQSANFLNSTDEDESVSLEKAIKRLTEAERCFKSEPFYSVNTSLKSQLQEGPKCGLVALSIATSMTDNFISANELFNEAVKRGFTTHGEMYNAKDLASLVEISTKFKTFVLDCGIYSHLDCIFHCIQNGGLMLIPYDADYNHSPCRRRGHSAHWAVMSGIVIFKLSDSEEDDFVLVEEGACVITNPGHYPACQCLGADNEKFFGTRPEKVTISRRAGKIYLIKNDSDLKDVPKCKIYLAGKQGKSKHLALWPFELLAESNNNLVELSEDQKGKQFTLPNGGISSGLKGKAILLNVTN